MPRYTVTTYASFQYYQEVEAPDYDTACDIAEHQVITRCRDLDIAVEWSDAEELESDTDEEDE